MNKLFIIIFPLYVIAFIHFYVSTERESKFQTMSGKKTKSAQLDFPWICQQLKIYLLNSGQKMAT